ncbi:DUF6285 domain-containing protein [Pseudomonas sp. I2]|uniref:DUF6285 domain-containing protein n=1 Tax=Pseudomonas sp. I2 TaxID=1338438 RepID=UPI0034D3B343
MTQPNAHQLLDIARQTLLEHVLPALSGDLRYQALMIANAMAIAAREGRLEAQVSTQEQARLSALSDGPQRPLPDVRRTLARDIREGRHDAPEGRHVLLETLHQVTRSRLTISNPKAVP